MALYWFEKGRKREIPWQAASSPEPKKVSVNPYQQQLDLNKDKPKKITLAHELMRGPVKTLSPNTSLQDAELFLRHNRIRHAPVVDPLTDVFEGILSDRDILRKWSGVGDSFLDWVSNSDNQNLYVSECMTTKVLTADPEEKLIEIARAMFSEKIGCMPIVNHEGKVVGIITRSDILRMIISSGPLNVWS